MEKLQDDAAHKRLPNRAESFATTLALRKGHSLHGENPSGNRPAKFSCGSVSVRCVPRSPTAKLPPRLLHVLVSIVRETKRYIFLESSRDIRGIDYKDAMVR